MTNFGKELKILGRHGLTYGVGQVLSRLVGFLMIPVYTHYLKPVDYGVYQLVGITVEAIGIVLSLGIANAVYRFYYDAEVNDQKSVISTACLAVPSISFVILGVINLKSEYMASIILERADQWVFFTLAFGTLWFNQQVDLVYTYLRVKQSSGTYLVLSLSKLIMALSLNIYFVVFLGWGVFGIFVSNFITAVFFSLLTFPLLLKKVGLVFSFTIAKKMLRFSLPMIPGNIASFAVNYSDRYFIRAFISIADAGIYTLGYRLGNVVFFLIRVPFAQIWGPRRYILYRDGAPAETYARIATYFEGMMIFVGLVISVFIQDVIKIISPQEYWNAALYCPAVALCYIIYAFDEHVNFGILIAKKTEYLTYVNLVIGALNLLLNFILISRYGIWGAILSTFLSFVSKIIAFYLIGMRFFRIPFEWYRMAGLLSVTIIIYFLSIIIHPASLIQSLIFDSFMVSIFLPAIWMTGLIRREEKDLLIKSIRKLFSAKSRELYPLLERQKRR